MSNQDRAMAQEIRLLKQQVRVLQTMLDLKDELLSYYRTTRRPSEAFWKRYDQAKAVTDKIKRP